MDALEMIPPIADDFTRIFGRQSGGLVRPYRCEDADSIVVALGSVNGTIQEVVDQERAAGEKIGAVSICSFRPFPLVALCDLLEGAKRVICVEKSLAPGLGGVLASNIRMALRGMTKPVYTVIARPGRPRDYPQVAGRGVRPGRPRQPGGHHLPRP